jgi:D-glycero-D-manno-heptose 1,7-bisphosphate phosphatase
VCNLKKAVFFDRDGTLIKSVHYLSRPDQVELIDGVSQVLTELKRADYLRIIVTNQAAIDKGLLTVNGLNEIQQRLGDLLYAEGASIDGWYYSPAARLSTDDETVDFVDRKPGPGMLLQAAKNFGITLKDSWMVGDRLSDALAGKNAGCKGSIIIAHETSNAKLLSHPAVTFVVPSIDQINKIILGSCNAE